MPTRNVKIGQFSPPKQILVFLGVIHLIYKFYFPKLIYSRIVSKDCHMASWVGPSCLVSSVPRVFTLQPCFEYNEYKFDGMKVLLLYRFDDGWKPWLAFHLLFFVVETKRLNHLENCLYYISLKFNPLILEEITIKTKRQSKESNKELQTLKTRTK